jgi:hypothetical protein
MDTLNTRKFIHRRYRMHKFFYALCIFLSVYSKYVSSICGVIAITSIALLSIIPKAEPPFTIIINIAAIFFSALSLVFSLLAFSPEFMSAAKIRMFLEHKFSELDFSVQTGLIAPEEAFRIFTKINSFERKMWNVRTDINTSDLEKEYDEL